MNDLVKKEFNEIFSPSDIEMLIKFEELETRVKAMKAEKDEALKEFLIRNNLTEEGFENDDIRITYVRPSTRKVIDSEALKKDGIYDLYTKESKVKDSVRVKVKYE